MSYMFLFFSFVRFNQVPTNRFTANNQVHLFNFKKVTWMFVASLLKLVLKSWILTWTLVRHLLTCENSAISQKTTQGSGKPLLCYHSSHPLTMALLHFPSTLSEEEETLKQTFAKLKRKVRTDSYRSTYDNWHGHGG